MYNIASYLNFGQGSARTAYADMCAFYQMITDPFSSKALTNLCLQTEIIALFLMLCKGAYLYDVRSGWGRGVPKK